MICSLYEIKEIEQASEKWKVPREFSQDVSRLQTTWCVQAQVGYCECLGRVLGKPGPGQTLMNTDNVWSP
jgi:hypothetical protein